MIEKKSEIKNVKILGEMEMRNADSFHGSLSGNKLMYAKVSYSVCYYKDIVFNVFKYIPEFAEEWDTFPLTVANIWEVNVSAKYSPTMEFLPLCDAEEDVLTEYLQEYIRKERGQL